jgi:predicted anti-sigma-YlaC factor YlaD
MNCKEMGEHLWAVAAGVPPEQQVETHLRTCAACRESLNQMRRTMVLLDEWKVPEPSPYFDVRLHARLREETAQAHGWLHLFRKPALAAAMAALLVAGSTLFITGQHPQGPSASAQSQAGAAVQDLQDLEKNHELFASFDLLDEVGDDSAQTMNP